MTDLTTLNVSLTKHGAHKIAALLKKYDSDDILNHTEGNELGIYIDRAQAKKNLSISRNGIVPDVWNRARKNGSETIDALVLVSIILSHHKLIDAVKQSTDKYQLSGTIKRGRVLRGKEFTNFAHIIEELGYSTEHSADFVRYDLHKLFQIPKLHNLIVDILKLKLITAGWDSKRNSIIEEATSHGLHEVFLLDKRQFANWLVNGSISTTLPNTAGFLDHDFFVNVHDDLPTGKFKFRAGHRNKKVGVVVVDKSVESQRAVLKHNKIQNQMYKTLIGRYGKSCVGTEVPTGDGTSIDIVVKTNKFCWFYEIKTDASVRGCIRQAIPQLLEYAYWQGDATNVDKLIIVSPLAGTQQSERYLAFLRNRFKLNIFYEQVVLAAD